MAEDKLLDLVVGAFVLVGSKADLAGMHMCQAVEGLACLADALEEQDWNSISEHELVYHAVTCAMMAVNSAAEAKVHAEIVAYFRLALVVIALVSRASHAESLDGFAYQAASSLSDQVFHALLSYLHQSPHRLRHRHLHS